MAHHLPLVPPSFTEKQLLDDIAEQQQPPPPPPPNHDVDNDYYLIPHDATQQHRDILDYSPPPYSRSTSSSSLGLGPSWPVVVSASGWTRRTRTLTRDEMTEWRRLRRDTGHTGRLALLRAGAVVEPFRPTPLVGRYGSDAVRDDRGRGLAAAAAAAAAEDDEDEDGDEERVLVGEATRGWMGCLWDWAARAGNRLKRAVRVVFARRKRVARRGCCPACPARAQI